TRKLAQPYPAQPDPAQRDSLSCAMAGHEANDVHHVSVEAYHRMPWQLGWLYEYYDGTVHPRPSHHAVVAELGVTAQPVRTSATTRPVTESDAASLSGLFFDAFHGTAEFYGYDEAYLRQQAAESVRDYFAGKRGAPHPVSAAAVA